MSTSVKAERAGAYVHQCTHLPLANRMQDIVLACCPVPHPGGMGLPPVVNCIRCLQQEITVVRGGRL